MFSGGGTRCRNARWGWLYQRVRWSSVGKTKYICYTNIAVIVGFALMPRYVSRFAGERDAHGWLAYPQLFGVVSF